MPSNAYQTFRQVLLKDVDELIKIHEQLKTGKKGRQGLGHITRSALFLLCAGFEHYIEEVCLNYVEIIISNNALQLTKVLKKNFADYVKRRKDEQYCLSLIGDGWKVCFREMAEAKISSFNSPKTEKIKELFEYTIDIEITEIIDESKQQIIDEFFTKRCVVAHKGANSPYPSINEVIKYRNSISEIIMLIDEYLAEEGKKLYSKKPWQSIAKNSKIKQYKAKRDKENTSNEDKS